MTDLHQKFNSIFRWQFFSISVISVIQLITIILLGRLLEYKELGSFALFQIVFRFALYCLDPGMFFSVVQKHESNLKLVQKLFVLQLVYVIISYLVLGLLSIFSDSFKELYGSLLINCFLIIIIIGIGSYFQSKLVQKFRQREIAIFQTLGYLAELLFVIVFCTKFNPVLVFSYGIILRFLIFYMLCFILVWNKSNCMETQELLNNTSRDHLEQNHYNIASQILSFFQGQYDTFIIISLFGMSTLGGYILTTEISYVIFSKLNPIFTKAIIPTVSKSMDDLLMASKLIENSMNNFLLISGLLYGFFWIFRLELFSFLFKDKSTDLSYYAIFLFIVAFSKSVNNIINSYFLALGFAKRIFHWNILLLIFNYLIFGIFYFFKLDLDIFLKFSVIYSLTITGIVYILLRKVILFCNIPEIKIQIRPLIIFLTCIIIMSGLHNFVLNTMISLCLSIISVLLILYNFERDRLNSWLKLKVI
ncbi:MAG: oligosaccharide flippase family protein [Saprospiraceae bacterium]|nr:oligosaccharide flippase family protein [Saprospiraceae bacterium]